MTTLTERIDTALPIDDTFAFVADFANSAIWDPGVATAERLDTGAVGLGSRFRLGVRLGGRVAPMEYRIAVFEPPTRVVLVGSGSGVVGGRRHPLRADRTAARGSTTRPTSGWVACSVWSSRSSVALSRRSGATPSVACSGRSTRERRRWRRSAGEPGRRVMKVGDRRVGHQRPDRRLRPPTGSRGAAVRGRCGRRRSRQDGRRGDRCRAGRRRHRVHRLQRAHLPDVRATAGRAWRRDAAQRHVPWLDLSRVSRRVQLARRHAATSPLPGPSPVPGTGG